ncbi:proline-rich receptor-like protein kinase PERK2 isoform X2 [Gigantopelta aegis]|uniref:proline-rich receptor-like protein kinase PERK2 isoform X2 n=1 Tax=Gigantopelta aegis TaxID=1735272 RepID=UPI001B88AB4D|nr:proline-rich receptor-like protein kinase PERK2 isoform X2 [Gigantopelta aegis]
MISSGGVYFYLLIHGSALPPNATTPGTVKRIKEAPAPPATPVKPPARKATALPPGGQPVKPSQPSSQPPKPDMKQAEVGSLQAGRPDQRFVGLPESDPYADEIE